MAHVPKCAKHFLKFSRSVPYQHLSNLVLVPFISMKEGRGKFHILLWFAGDLELQLHHSAGTFTPMLWGVFLLKYFIYAVRQLNLLGPSDIYAYPYTSDQIVQMFPLLRYLDYSNRPSCIDTFTIIGQTHKIETSS